MAAVDAERYGDCATAPSAASPISTDRGVHEHEREVDHGAGGVGADHDDAAVEAVAEHAGEGSRSRRCRSRRAERQSPRRPNGSPKTSAMSATKATSPPATESMRPMERRWTAVL